MSSVSRADILKDLKADIFRLQKFKGEKNATCDMGLGAIEDAFPNGSFPLGAIHEFLPAETENIAPVGGFVVGLLSSLMESYDVTLWISSARTLFPPALKSFGLEPDRFIFIDVQNEKDVLWAMDEALKCGALSAVVGEVRDIGFTASRRLQLAVEQSQTTGFIIRKNNRNLNTTACISRWKIASLPSQSDGDMPGIGFPKWRVELLRMRNGKTGAWDIQWIDGRFLPLQNASTGKPASREASTFDGSSVGKSADKERKAV